MTAKPKRRWYQFSLRTLLVAVTVVAAAATWYGYRLRLVERERGRLGGKWFVNVDETFVRIFEVSDPRLDLLVPDGEMGRIDFHMVDGSGISRGIYCSEGDRITVVQAEVNHPRPTRFEKANGISVWKGVRRP